MLPRTDCDAGIINQGTIAGKKMQTPSVAIVILNWNGRGFLEKFLPSVLASVNAGSPVHKQLIVADNASTDDSVIFLK